MVTGVCAVKLLKNKLQSSPEVHLSSQVSVGVPHYNLTHCLYA